MASGTVTVNILGDASRLKRALGESDSALGRFQGRMQAVGRSLFRTGAIMTAGITAPLALMAKTAVDSLGRIQTINAQTSAAIASTGGAANVTAEHVENLAGSFERLTGREAEATQEGANLLLTFTRIRNEVGEGNKIFDRATLMVQDMAVALGTDSTSAALQLGKALNDPILGMTALGRAGVQFTQAQKDAITEMVETGDVLGAQRLILKELETQVGGSAEAWGETLPGQLEKAKHAFGEVTESLAAGLLPAITEVAKFGQTLTDLFERLSPGMQKFAGFALLGLAALGPLVSVLGALVTVVAFVASGVGLVVVGLAALVAGFVFAYRNSETFRDIVNGAAQAVKDWAIENWPVVRDTIVAAFNDVKAWVEENWPAIRQGVLDAFEEIKVWTEENWPNIRDIIVEVFNIIKTSIEITVAIVTTIWRNFGDEIVSTTGNAFRAVGESISIALQAIRGFLQVISGLMTGDWSKFWEGIKAIVSAAWRAIVGLFKANWAAIQGIFAGANNLIASILFKGMALAKQIVASALDAIVGFFQRLPGRIAGAVARVGSTIRGLIGQVTGLGNLPGFDAGGIVPGPRGRAQLAVVHGGEMILPTHRTGGGGMGGNTYNINVNVPLRAAAGDVGRELVEAITAFERSNSPRWRQ